MQTIKIIIAVLVLGAIAYGGFRWMKYQDEAQAEWTRRYDACVMDEYGTTPAAWYAEHGEAPACDISKY